MVLEKYKKELEKLEKLVNLNLEAYYNTDYAFVPGINKLRENLKSKQPLESIQQVEKFGKEIKDILIFLNDQENDYLLYIDFEMIRTSVMFNQCIDQSFLHFSYKEQLEIILYFIKKNLEHHILDQDKQNFKRSIWKSFYSHLSEKEFEKLYDVEMKKDSEKRDLYFRKVLLKSEKNWYLKKNVSIAHRMLKKYYFDKKENFSEKDLSFVVKSFAVLGLDSTMCDAFKVLLKKKIKARKEEKEGVSKRKITPLNQKETKKLYREIMEMYNIDDQRVIRPLTLSEIILLVEKMKKMNVNQKEIIKFICNVNKEGLEAYKNSRVKLSEYYPKLVLYARNETVNYLNDCIKEMLTMQNCEDYSFWKKNMEETLNKALLEVQKVYEYEFNEGMKLH